MTPDAPRDSLTRYAPLSGLAVFVLFAVGNLLWSIDIPATDAPGGELASFYEDRSTQIIVGASLSIVAVVLFVWFSALLRDRLEARTRRARCLAADRGVRRRDPRLHSRPRGRDDQHGGRAAGGERRRHQPRRGPGLLRHLPGPRLQRRRRRPGDADRRHRRRVTMRGSQILPRGLAVPALILSVTPAGPGRGPVDAAARDPAAPALQHPALPAQQRRPEEAGRYGARRRCAPPERPPSGFSSCSLPCFEPAAWRVSCAVSASSWPVCDSWPSVFRRSSPATSTALPSPPFRRSCRRPRIRR